MRKREAISPVTLEDVLPLILKHDQREIDRHNPCGILYECDGDTFHYRIGNPAAPHGDFALSLRQGSFGPPCKPNHLFMLNEIYA